MPPPIRPFVPIALYEGALDALPLGLLVFRLDDPDDPGSLRLLYGNDAADRTTGADFRANLGRPIREFLPSLLETDLAERYAEVARTSRERDLGDVRFGGDVVKEALYNVRAFGLPDQSVGVLFEDVTEARGVEERQMQEVTGLADAALEGILLSDGRRVLLANRALAEMTGYTRAELAGLDVLEIAAEEHRDAIRKRIEAKSTEPYEAALRRKDGTTIPVDIRGRYVEYNGATVRATAIRDLTERVQALREVHALREAEEALREEAKTLATINRVNATLAAELDPEKLVQAVTDAGTELTEAHFGAFFYNVVNRAGEAYMLYTISGVPREAFEQFPMPRNTEIFAPTFAGEGVVRLDDVTEDPRYGKNAPHAGMPEGHLPVRSYLAAPVKGREGEVIGGLFFGHPEPGVFDERAEQIVVALADQAAIALQNARLYTALQAELDERAQAEAALRESESRYRLLADTATDVIVTVGTDNVIRYANRAAETVFGYAPEALVGQPLTTLMPEGYRGRHEAAMARYVETGEKRVNWAHVEVPGLRKDGTTIPLNISFGEYRHGEDRLFTGILRDVSGQQAAREALAESEATLRAMVEQATVGVIVTDPTSGRFLRVNERYAELTGRTPDDLLGASLFDLLPPEERAADEEAFAAMARGELAEYAREKRYVLPDGTPRWVYATARLLDIGGGPPRAVHIVQDVTERREAEVAVHRALRHAEEAERRLIAVVDNLPELAWAARPDGHIDFYNRRWYDYTGTTPAAMEGWGWTSVHDPAILPEVEARWRDALTTGEPFEMEFPLRGAGGQFRWFLTRAHPIRDAEGAIVRWVGTNTDVDEQRRLLAERDAALDRMAEGEARLRLVVRATNDAVWDWDLATDRVVWNRALEERFGWAEAATDGTDGAWWKARIHPDDRDRVVEAIHHVIDGDEETWQTEYRFACASGGWADVFDRGSVVRDADGAPARMVGAMIDLTEQKRAERALRESERQFRLLTDAVPQLVWTSTAEGVPDYYNEQWYAYTGMPRPEEREGAPETNWGDYLHPDDRAGAFAAFGRAAAAGAAFEYEYRFRRHDGAYRWFLGRALPTHDDEGRVVRWVGSATDIQELREAREAMAESEAHFRAVFEQAGVGVVVMDPTTGEFLRVNERYAEMAGRTPEELLGVSVFEFIHPDDRERDRRMFARLARGEAAAVAHEKRYLHPDGTLRWVKVDARLLPGAEGARPRAVSILQDVTEERLAEAALRESEARFRAIADTLPQIAWTTRPDGYHEYFNERWYEYTGMPRPGEPGGLDQGFNWKDYLHPDDVERSVARWTRSLESGEPYEVEYRFRRAADGAFRWFIGRAEPVRDDEGAIVRWYGTCTDIHDQKEAARLLEAHVAERTAEARAAAERLDAVLNGTTDLIAAIDTDFRILAVNAGFQALWQRLFDYPLRAGMTIEEALPDQPEEQAKSRAQWGRVLAGESFTTLEASEHPALGKVAFETHYSPIRDDAGAITGGVAVIRDVTDRERATQAVEAFAADLRQLHAVTTADHASTEALLEDYLHAGRTILALPFAAVVETDEAAGTWRARAGLAPEGAPLPTEGPLEGTATALVLQTRATLAVADTEAGEGEGESKGADGGEEAQAARAVAALGVRSYVGTPVYVGDEVAGVLGFASPEPRGGPLAPHEVELVEILAELIGHALAVERARQAERTADLRYRTLVEAMDEGVVLHDADGRITAWNEAAERALGLTAEELGGRSPADGRWRTVHADGRPFPGEEHPAAVALRTGVPQRNVIMGVYHPSGELRWLTVNAAPLRDEEAAPDGRPTGAVASFADVTALKRAEDALRGRGAELEERNAELEQFAYVASHDLQEPLRTVASFLQLLERRYAADLDARAQEYIAFAVDGSRRMQALIQGLLTYSRIGTRGRPFEPVDAGAVARDVLVDLGPALGEAGAVVEADDLPVVCADPTQLHQLLLNLVSNAVKFRREGVPPRVAIAAAKGREGGRAVWAFTVTDNGIGLEPKYADRVFQLFQRLHTRDEYPGTGIGLAVCKKIVERHGGALGYSPAPEGGTTFTFTLPIRPLDDCDAAPGRGRPNLADAE